MDDPSTKSPSEMKPMFVHSQLDEYGLTAAQFRAYGHLARRASSSGEAFPKIASIARICRLHPQTVRQALRFLVQHRLITREPRPGTTPIYRLTPMAQWQPPKRIDGNISEIDTPVSVTQDSPAKRIQGQSYETDVGKGNPLEDNPRKVNPHSPPKGDSVKNTGSSSSQAEEIYLAYPKDVGMPAALRAIRRVLAKHPFDFLLERTRLYARTYNGDPQFIPYPARWFNEERFNNDPATWHRTVGATGKPQPTIIRSDNFGCGVSKL